MDGTIPTHPGYDTLFLFLDFRQLLSLLLPSEELHTDTERPDISPLLVMWGDRLGTSGTPHQRDCFSAG